MRRGDDRKSETAGTRAKLYVRGDAELCVLHICVSPKLPKQKDDRTTHPRILVMAAKVGGPRGVESRAVVPVSVIAGALQGREKAYVKRAALSPPIIYQSRNIGPIRPAIPGQATCLKDRIVV